MKISKSKQFEKQYRKLPTKQREKFAERLRLYPENKNHELLHVHSLSGAYKGLWSFKVSAAIRVIFDDSYPQVLLLVAIGSHSELYS